MVTRITFLLLVWSVLVLPLSAQTRGVVEGEYFWGSDPGEGNGTALVAADGSFGEVLESLVASGVTAPATTGAVNFNARLKDSAGVWGSVFSTTVQIEAAVIDPAAPSRKLAAGEYFWGSDPGEGNGTAFSAADGTYDEVMESLLASGVTAPSSETPTTFNVRLKDSSDQWGVVFTTAVNVETVVIDPPAPARGLMQGEYFWGTDPGNGNGTSFTAADGNINEVLETLQASGVTAPERYGPSTLNARLRDMQGNWGAVFSTVVHSSIYEQSGIDFSDDDDGDGLDKITEYFLGSSDTEFNEFSEYASVGLDLRNPGDGSNSLFLQISPKWKSLDTQLTVEISPDLSTWYDISDGWLIQTQNTDSVLEYYSTRTIEDESKLFMRMRVESMNP